MLKYISCINISQVTLENLLLIRLVAAASSTEAIVLAAAVAAMAALEPLALLRLHRNARIRMFNLSTRKTIVKR